MTTSGRTFRPTLTAPPAGDLAELLTAELGQPVVLPVEDPAEGTWARFPTPATWAALEDAGLACAVEPGVS